MGFGRAANHQATLGRPLDMTLPLRVEPGEVLDESCVKAEVLFGESRVPSQDVRIDIERVSAQERLLRLRTVSPVDEPVVNVTMTVGCESRITRKIVAFADPPLMPPTMVVREGGSLEPDAPRAMADANSSLPAVIFPNTPAQAAAEEGTLASAGQTGGARAAPRSSPASSASGTAARADHSARRSAAARKAAAAPLDPVAPVAPVVVAQAELQPASRAASSLGSSRITPEHAGEGPRLQLDPIELDAQNAPLLRTSQSMTTPQADGGPRRAAAAALWKVLNASPEELAKQAERLAQLESDLNRLRTSSTNDKAVVSGLQSRLREAQARQYNNPIVYGLAGLCVALGAAIAYLLWRRREESAVSTSWWSPTVDGQHSVQGTMELPGRGELVDTHAHTVAAVSSPEPEPRDSEQPAVVVSEFGTEASHTAPAEHPYERHESAREVSVEELIDLEQQVDFFLVLGQDEAAIDLLLSHVEGTAGTSPLPFLKLLEIYQKRGARAEYERIRERFNTHFNAYAPDWDADLEKGRSIEDYPAVADRLAAIWSAPGRALEVLQASLLRQDGDESTFDLPAYRELLFLYGLARDLAEREQRQLPDSGLDFELPAVSTEPGFGPTVVQPLLATTPLHVQMGTAVAPELNIDLDLDMQIDRTVDLALPLDEAPVSNAYVDPSHRMDFDPIDLPLQGGVPAVEPKPPSAPASRFSGLIDLDLIEEDEERPRKS